MTKYTVRAGRKDIFIYDTYSEMVEGVAANPSIWEICYNNANGEPVRLIREQDSMLFKEAEEG